MSSKVDNRQACNKSLQDEQKKFRDLNVGDNVVVFNFSQGPKWLSGQVMERAGSPSHKTAVGDKVFHRHIDQICKVHLQVHISGESENIDICKALALKQLLPLRSGLIWVHKKVFCHVDLREAEFLC